MSKVWFVTGAGSGIGAAIAKAALKAGDRVVATGRDLGKVRGALAGAPRDSIEFAQLDVADPAQAQASVEVAVARFGRIDVLVNNAGYSILGNFEEMTRADLEGQFATNFYGVANLMRAALPVMRRQRAGHVINISSVAGVVGLKHCAAYGASKFAVEGLSLAVAEEVAPFDIHITLVEPGFFRTDLLTPDNARWAGNPIDDYAAEGSPQAMWSPYDGIQPGDPARLGEALVSIASMQDPPRVFAAGSDALEAVIPAIEARLQTIRDHAALSKSTDGVFQDAVASPVLGAA
ncbi:NAD(P)-dependent dehydrogenase (short-subunit alcohol dehydrogenase family) [Caulobacter ginsengisoli]|uniref:NAD(P)-dependent dehydrogenase (Short-subunit alcohol dehydrogenase family) n=1 Tax=Caulobacter ginsengisoli TaxID=400775 RepID=A0ABU0IMP8_9CAUL|nr:SDR family NAD(P)-dependent oxidoreductase [Caulobacter ginsengisoli]MDQ0463284.1 NAD(P)-dependent dehydrogenase (short-subunit alcohol dehydrogenase family) [Caulobacter ginsengisoli]